MSKKIKIGDQVYTLSTTGVIKKGIVENMSKTGNRHVAIISYPNIKNSNFVFTLNNIAKTEKEIELRKQQLGLEGFKVGDTVYVGTKDGVEKHKIKKITDIEGAPAVYLNDKKTPVLISAIHKTEKDATAMALARMNTVSIAKLYNILGEIKELEGELMKQRKLAEKITGKKRHPNTEKTAL